MATRKLPLRSAFQNDIENNIEYGEAGGEKLLLDAHVPEGSGKFPVVLIVHGGGWMNGDKTGYGENMIQPFLDAGISVAALNYRFIRQAMDMLYQRRAKKFYVRGGER